MDLQTSGGKPVTSENALSPDNFRAHSPQTADHSRLQPDTHPASIRLYLVAARRGPYAPAATSDLAAAKEASRETPSHLPLGQVRPGSRLLETERKLLTHAIRMSAYNAESALARLRRPHYARGDDEARPSPRSIHPHRRPADHRRHLARAPRPRQRPPTQQRPGRAMH